MTVRVVFQWTTAAGYPAAVLDWSWNSGRDFKEAGIINLPHVVEDSFRLRSDLLEEAIEVGLIPCPGSWVVIEIDQGCEGEYELIDPFDRRLSIEAEAQAWKKYHEEVLGGHEETRPSEKESSDGTLQSGVSLDP